jgi:hypothetical protein
MERHERPVVLRTMRATMKTKLLKVGWLVAWLFVSLMNTTAMLGAVPAEPGVAVVSGALAIFSLYKLGAWWEAILSPPDTPSDSL